MTRRRKYPDSPRRKDYPDMASYKRAYGKWLHKNGYVRPRSSSSRLPGKLPSSTIKSPSKPKKKDLKKNPYGHGLGDRSTSAEAALVRRTKIHTAKVEASILESIELLDHWEGPDLDLDASTYLLENSILDKNCF